MATSTLCCCLTLSSKWKLAVHTQTPNMESALRISLGGSYFSVFAGLELKYIACFSAWGFLCLWFIPGLFVIFLSGVWSSSAAAIDRLTGGVTKSTGWQKPVTFWKCNVLMASLHRGRTHSQNGKMCCVLQLWKYVPEDFILIPQLVWMLFEGMWMEVATSKTWLMHLNKQRRKSSSQIGGKFQQNKLYQWKVKYISIKGNFLISWWAFCDFFSSGSALRCT